MTNSRHQPSLINNFPTLYNFQPTTKKSRNVIMNNSLRDLANLKTVVQTRRRLQPNLSRGQTPANEGQQPTNLKQSISPRKQFTRSTLSLNPQPVNKFTGKLSNSRKTALRKSVILQGHSTTSIDPLQLLPSQLSQLSHNQLTPTKILFSNGSSNMPQNVSPNVSQNMLSNVSPNRPPNMLSNVSPNMLSNVSPNRLSNVSPNRSQFNTKKKRKRSLFTRSLFTRKDNLSRRHTTPTGNSPRKKTRKNLNRYSKYFPYTKPEGTSLYRKYPPQSYLSLPYNNGNNKTNKTNIRKNNYKRYKKYFTTKRKPLLQPL
jgi:hypothetical protein